MWTTTLNKISEHDPCLSGWRKLLAGLGKTTADDEPLTIATILRINGLDDALWALQAVDEQDREIRNLACDYAEFVLPVWEAKYPDDQRPRQAIEVARRYADGMATTDELDVAGTAACDAACDASRDAAWATACDAALAAALAAACDAARAAARAAGAATWDYARAAALASAGAATWASGHAADEREWQDKLLLNYCNEPHTTEKGENS